MKMANISAIDQFTQQSLSQTQSKSKEANVSFSDYLQQSLNMVNESQKVAEKMSADVAAGKSEHIHETMLALTQAELTFNMAVQVRNKALESYQEVMRMQV